MSSDDVVGNPTRLFGHEQAVEVDDSVRWSRARWGDSEAFGMLFERHARTIYNFCFRRVGGWRSAQDLVSIVFLQAWRRVDKQLPRGKELPWLFGIATNVVRNRRRAERRYAAALRRVSQPSSEPSFADDSDQRIDDEELMGRALSLLGTTSPSRAGGLCALRLVRAQLRGRGGRSADAGRNRSLATFTRTCPLAGTRSRHRT